MSDNDLSIALRATRLRAANLADSILRAERDQALLAVALDSAQAAGAMQDQVDLQIRLACADRPDRAVALERLRLIGENA